MGGLAMWRRIRLRAYASFVGAPPNAAVNLVSNSYCFPVIATNAQNTSAKVERVEKLLKERNAVCGKNMRTVA